jgi:hypothetical protein
MRRFLVLLLLALVLPFLAGGAAVAENFGTTKKSGYPDRGTVNVGYESDGQTLAFRTGLAGADTLTTSGIKATTTFVAKGRQTIIVNGRFSSPSATAVVRLAYVFRDELTGAETVKGYSAKQTLTADSTQYEGAYYPAPDALFDSEAGVTLRVLVLSLSAGTVDLWVGSE